MQYPNGNRLISLRNWLVMLFVISGCNACTTVQPWERGVLAKPQMAAQTCPLQDGLRQHIYGARESVNGATFSSGGGGCGCN